MPSPSEHSSLGFFDFLEDYFQTDRPTYLLDALNAAALSCYAHFSPNLRHLSIGALDSRGRALRNLATVLRDVEKAKSDDVLLALYLIERSEVRLSTAYQPNRREFAHKLLADARHRQSVQEIAIKSCDWLFDYPTSWWSIPVRYRTRLPHGPLDQHLAYSEGCILWNSSILRMPEDVFPRQIGRQSAQAHVALIGLMRRFRAIMADGLDDPESLQNIRTIGTEAEAWVAEIESWSIEEIEPVSATIMPLSIYMSRSTITMKLYSFRHFMDAVALCTVWNVSFRYRRLMIDCIKNLSTISSEAVNDFPTLDQAMNRLADTAKSLAGIVPFLLGQLPSKDQPYPKDYRTGRGSFAGCIFTTSICILISGTRELHSHVPALPHWAMSTLLEMSALYGNKQAQAFHDAYRDIPRDVLRDHFSPWAPKSQPTST